VSLLSSTTTTAHLRLLLYKSSRLIRCTTAHLLAHLLEELACLFTSHELEVLAVTTTTSHRGRVTGRTVEGDKSFRGSRSRHSVLYYLEEKFLRL
jgi:hypothetical protein